MGRVMGVGWLFLFMICKESAPSLVMRKYGCEFDDDRLNYHQPFPAKPIFGNSDSDDIIRFFNERKYYNFLMDISKCYAELVDEAQFDSLSDYLKFYKAYKKEKKSGKGFVDFYKDYPVNFESNYAPGAIVIALVNKIVYQYPLLEQSIFFITKKQDYDGEWMNAINNDIYLPKYFQDGQIAAIIKYVRRYNDPSVQNYEYILLDPEIRPAKLFFFSERIRTYEKDNIKFEMQNTNIITATVTEEASSSQGSQTPSSKYVYYFGKPYCSFVETTMKPNLLKPIHSIRRNQKGVEVVKILAQVANGEVLPNFQMILYASLQLSFTLSEREDIQKEIMMGQKKVETVCKVLGIKKTKCLKYWIENIQLLQEISKDTTFQSKCQSTLDTLRNQLGQDFLVKRRSYYY